MKIKLIISGLLFTVCTMVYAQSMIGLSKAEVKERVRSEYQDFGKDPAIVKQQFNYLKYVNRRKTRTWIIHFTDENICKSTKLVCDYSDFDEVTANLSSSFKKTGESQWEYTSGPGIIQVTLTKQEWYFTVREARKK